MTLLIITAVGLVTAFFILTVAVFFDSPSVRMLDTHVAGAITRFSTPGWSSFWNQMTSFGGVIGIPIISVLVILLTQFDTTVVMRGIIAVGGSALIVQILKIFIARARPEKLPWRSAEFEFSYPSGHTAAATALCGFIMTLLPLTTAAGLCGIVIAIVAIICIAFSRMALSVHYASDILGGLLLGTLGIIAAYIII